jgi:hypothetical protein
MTESPHRSAEDIYAEKLAEWKRKRDAAAEAERKRRRRVDEIRLVIAVVTATVSLGLLTLGYLIWQGIL